MQVFPDIMFRWNINSFLREIAGLFEGYLEEGDEQEFLRRHLDKMVFLVDGLDQIIEKVASKESSMRLTFLQDSREMGRISVRSLVNFIDAGGKIPQMETLKLMAIEIAENTPYHRRLGLDMTVDETGRPYVIEVNNGPLGTAQYLNGGLFKQYTDEVIEYCKSNKSKVNFNFTK